MFLNTSSRLEYFIWLKFIFTRSSIVTSYEDLSTRETVEMREVPEIPLAPSLLEEQQRPSMVNARRLVRQSSVMDTQRDSDGTMKMTYWF